jgi:hypothetical protein
MTVSGQPMKFVRRLEALPQIFLFYCSRYQRAETMAQEGAA